LEVVIVLFVLGLLGLQYVVQHFLVFPPNRAAICRSRMIPLFRGTRLYLDGYDHFFPPAWHEGSGDGFHRVTYSRFLIHDRLDYDFRFHRTDAESDKADLLRENLYMWACPVKGLTNDYFSPPRIFQLPRPDEMAKPFDRHTQYLDLTFRVPGALIPFLGEATASTPQDDAENDAPLETRAGIYGAYKSKAFTLSGKTYDAFYGVARSWVGWHPEAKEGSGPQRFDFRHNGAINVIYLDGHIDTIKQNDAAHLRALHEKWNGDSEGAP